MSLPEKNSFNNLGGELQDYSPVTDPTTDLSAAADNETRADVAAMTRTATRAWVAFTVNGSVINVAGTDYDAVYGNDVINKPTIVKNSPGDYTITFPVQITDALGIIRFLNLQMGWANIEDNQGYFANAKKISSNTFRVFVWSTQDGQLADPFTINDRVNLMVV